MSNLVFSPESGQVERRRSPGVGWAGARRSRAGRAGGWELLFLPGLLVLLYVFVLPLVIMTSNSLHPSLGLGQVGAAWTVANYQRFFGDPFYWGVVMDTVLLGVTVVFFCAILGYPIAYFLARDYSRWRGALIFAVLSPLLVSVIIRNLGWIPVLGRNGMVNTVLQTVGIADAPVQLLHNFTGVLIGLVHALSPFMILSLMVVIRRIDIELEQAALGLGAGRLQTFLRVVLPMSRQGLLGGSLLVFSLAISAFTTAAMMGGKRMLFLSTFIEQQVRTVLNYPFGATAAVALLAITVLFTILAMRLMRGQAQ